MRHWITSFVLVEHDPNVGPFGADDKCPGATVAANGILNGSPPYESGETL